jgi:hypothetical protein
MHIQIRMPVAGRWRCGDLESEFLFLLPTDGPPHALGAIGINPRIEPRPRRLT